MPSNQINITTADNPNNVVTVLSDDRVIDIKNGRDVSTINVSQTESATVLVGTLSVQGPKGETGPQGPQGNPGDADLSSLATTGSNTFRGDQTITGSLTVSGSSTFRNIGPAIFSGSVTSTNGFTGSLLGTATTASYISPAFISASAAAAGFGSGGGDTTGLVTTGSFNSFTSSINSFTQSILNWTGSVVTNTAFNSFTQSYNTGSFSGSLVGIADTASYYNETDPIFTAKSGSLATTGSNTFVGYQIVSGSIYMGTGSIILPNGTEIYDIGNSGSTSGIGLGNNGFSIDFGSNVNDWARFTNANLIQMEPSNQFNIVLAGNETGWSFNGSGMQFPDLTTQTTAYTGPIETGSFITNTQTGSMLSPYLLSSQTSSFVTNNQTGSFVLNQQTGSFATTGSNTFRGNQTISGSINVTGSMSVSTGITASLLGTASWANNYIESDPVYNSEKGNYIQIGDSNSNQSIYGRLNVSKLNTTEISGSDVYVGLNNNANINVVYPPQPVDVAGSILFNRESGDYLSLSPGAGYDSFSYGFLTSCWFKLTTDEFVGNFIDGAPLFYSSTDSSSNLYVYISSSLNQIVVNNGLDRFTFTTPETIQINNWYFLTVVYDNNAFINVTGSLYLNGTASIDTYYSSSWMNNFPNTTDLIGTDGNGNFFPGYMTDIRLLGKPGYNEFISASIVPTLPVELTGNEYSGLLLRVSSSGTWLNDLTANQTVTANGRIQFDGDSPYDYYSQPVNNIWQFNNNATLVLPVSGTILNNDLSAYTASYASTASYYAETDPIYNAEKGKYLTTGSTNTAQTIVGSLVIDQNLTVLGSQSIQYITSSQLNIGTNLITVNTATPAIRFGGLAVYDSGSTGLTGSLLWDSQTNVWIYTNPSGSSNYDGGMLLTGPRNSIGVGNEVGINSWYAAIGNGSHHMTSSAIWNSGSLIRLERNTEVVGTLNVTAGITGSFNGNLVGTASWADSASNAINAETASYINANNVFGTVASASNAINAQTASYTPYNQTIGARITTEDTYITAGSKGYRHVAIASRITKIRTIANTNGSIDVNIRRDGTNLGNINLTNQSASLDTTLTGWTTGLNTNDLIEFYVSQSSVYITDITIFIDTQAT